MKKIFLISTLLLTACATQTTILKSYPATTPNEITVSFDKNPSCKYEELAFINTSFWWNTSMAVDKAKENAASIGADYIKITNVTTNSDNDAKVGAIAYKCIK